MVAIPTINLLRPIKAAITLQQIEIRTKKQEPKDRKCSFIRLLNQTNQLSTNLALLMYSSMEIWCKNMLTFFSA